jgi:hypothetical protein
MEIIVKDIFAYNITLDILKDNEGFEPILIEEYHHKSNWHGKM